MSSVLTIPKGALSVEAPKASRLLVGTMYVNEAGWTKFLFPIVNCRIEARPPIGDIAQITRSIKPKKLSIRIWS